MSWISVKDDLPEYDQLVLIWYKHMVNGNAAVAFCEVGKWYLFHTSTSDEPINEPDYWMPIPEPPKEENP